MTLGVVAPARAAGVNVKDLITNNQALHPALLEDTALVNAWGIAHSGSSPFWVSDNGTGLTTIYRVNPVTDLPTKVPFAGPMGGVSIPGDGSVTGQVFNSASATSFGNNVFLFVSEDGTISGWKGGASATVLQLADPLNVYKGTTLDVSGGNAYLLSANFGRGTIDVFKDPGTPALAGTFVDPNLPSGYAPFNVQVLDGKVYVTYALKSTVDPKDDAPGAGHGFVTAFDLQGNLLGRIGTMGGLNSPWGLAIAPSSWTGIAGDLLVGNFGDGRINIFHLNSNDTGTPLGFLQANGGGDLAIDGLWGLIPGNGNANGGSTQKIYFSAGPDGEENGLFGVLSVPEPSSVVLGLIAVGMLGARWQWRNRRRAAMP